MEKTLSIFLATVVGGALGALLGMAVVAVAVAAHVTGSLLMGIYVLCVTVGAFLGFILKLDQWDAKEFADAARVREDLHRAAP